MEYEYNWTNWTNLTAEQLKQLEAEILAYRASLQEKNGLAASDSVLPTESFQQLELPLNWRVGLICAFSVNIVLSTIGNIIVITVLLFSKRQQSELNLFLINLALADLTMAIFCMPFTFSTIMYGHWIFSTAMCPAVIFFQQVSVIVSVYTLIAIGIDRYFAVLYPLKVRVTKNRAKILFALIWLVSVLLAIVQTVFAKARKSYYGEKMFYICTEWWPLDSAGLIYEIFMVMVTYFIPLLVLLFCYVRVGRRLWGRHIPGNADHQRDKSYLSSKKKVIKMLILVVVLFMLCWLPLHVFMLVTRLWPYVYIDAETQRQDLMRKINSVVLWIATSNSFMNPVIYSFLNGGFRADVKSLLLRERRRSQAGRTQNKRRRSVSSSLFTANSILSKRLPSTRISSVTG
ncbi:neuromedin-K receptor-like [Ptychodera flava]|uniref:neuromedin-K receptor-like n=1 Tax=Ptychodera flava TaxID=63121 RepID=UPI00396A4AD6